MKVWELMVKLRSWDADEEVRVEIDGDEGVIEEVDYYAAHDEGFVVIYSTAVLDD